MLARGLFNKQNKSSSRLSIVRLSVLAKQNRRLKKKVYSFMEGILSLD